ncbi:MAG: hypothetical protein EP338_11780 [Bacteroidetes bacterium]|nr:MAG: hypothetical protein EP338_11780 [Bacteroidota bacterium]
MKKYVFILLTLCIGQQFQAQTKMIAWKSHSSVRSSEFLTENFNLGIISMDFDEEVKLRERRLKEAHQVHTKIPIQTNTKHVIHKERLAKDQKSMKRVHAKGQVVPRKDIKTQERIIYPTDSLQRGKQKLERPGNHYKIEGNEARPMLKGQQIQKGLGSNYHLFFSLIALFLLGGIIVHQRP